MKKILFGVFMLAFLPLLVKADPAKKVGLTYANGKLKIEVTHKVKDVSTHFISQIIVTVDDKEVKTLKFEKQSAPEGEVQELEIPEIKAGCIVKVKATCNKFGSKTEKLKIE